MDSLVHQAVTHRPEPSYTAEERRNIEVVRQVLSLPKPLKREDVARLFAPNFRLNRLGMRNLAELAGIPPTDYVSHPGYNDASMSDRTDHVIDMIARDDVVWVLFAMRGTHTGDFWGAPATGNALDLPELGVLRLSEGRVAECWYMNDELAICVQLGIPVGVPRLVPRSDEEVAS